MRKLFLLASFFLTSFAWADLYPKGLQMEEPLLEKVRLFSGKVSVDKLFGECGLIVISGKKGKRAPWSEGLQSLLRDESQHRYLDQFDVSSLPKTKAFVQAVVNHVLGERYTEAPLEKDGIKLKTEAQVTFYDALVALLKEVVAGEKNGHRLLFLGQARMGDATKSTAFLAVGNETTHELVSILMNGSDNECGLLNPETIR